MPKPSREGSVEQGPSGDSEVHVPPLLLLTDGVSLGKRRHLSETRSPYVKGEQMFITSW